MNVYYCGKMRSWYQTEILEGAVWGAERAPLAFRGKDPDILPAFSVRVEDGRAGPLIGILAASAGPRPISGNFRLFFKLQEYMNQTGGASFVFSLENIGDTHVEGWYFCQVRQVWRRADFPYPDVVFNRIPSRSKERTTAFQKAAALFQEKNIPFFNPGFLDKADLFVLFKEHPLLSRHIPETIVITGKSPVASFLAANRTVYIKPALSWGGNGIFRLSLLKDGRVHGETTDGNRIYSGIDSFWDEHGVLFLKKKYLAQMAVSPLLQGGRRFDFRVLAHASGFHHTITGIGIREAFGQQVTTHIMKGGRTLSFHEIDGEKHTPFLEKAVELVGKCLSDNFGFFGEFSLDAGISSDGHYFIYEVNSKPMVFDEEWIEGARIKKLCTLFQELSGFREEFSGAP